MNHTNIEAFTTALSKDNDISKIPKTKITNTAGHPPNKKAAIDAHAVNNMLCVLAFIIRTHIEVIWNFD